MQKILNKKCVCGINLSDYRSERCKSCSKKGNLNPMFDKNLSASPNWKGGKGITTNGYLRLSLGKRKRITEHRFIMEKHLGRKLRRDEIVHHKNNDKLDNRISNLVLMNQSQHVRLHNPRLGTGKNLILNK